MAMMSESAHSLPIGLLLYGLDREVFTAEALQGMRLHNHMM